jgi:hypothetical protein
MYSRFAREIVTPLGHISFRLLRRRLTNTLHPAILFRIHTPLPTFLSDTLATDRGVQKVQINVTECARFQRFLDLVDRVQARDVCFELCRVEYLFTCRQGVVFQPIRDGATACVFVFVPAQTKDPKSTLSVSVRAEEQGRQCQEGTNHSAVSMCLYPASRAHLTALYASSFVIS